MRTLTDLDAEQVRRSVDEYRASLRDTRHAWVKLSLLELRRADAQAVSIVGQLREAQLPARRFALPRNPNVSGESSSGP